MKEGRVFPPAREAAPPSRGLPAACCVAVHCSSGEGASAFLRPGKAAALEIHLKSPVSLCRACSDSPGRAGGSRGAAVSRAWSGRWHRRFPPGSPQPLGGRPPAPEVKQRTKGPGTWSPGRRSAKACGNSICCQPTLLLSAD